MTLRRSAKIARILLIAAWSMFGFVGVYQLCADAWIKHVMYRPAGPERETPDVDRIAACGPRVAPVLCMAVAQLWEELPTEPAGRMFHWVTALGKRQDRRATPTLIALTDHDHHWVRQWAAHALCDLQDSRAIPCLTRLLEDPDEIVRLSAEMALDNMGARR